MLLILIIAIIVIISFIIFLLSDEYSDANDIFGHITVYGFLLGIVV